MNNFSVFLFIVVLLLAISNSSATKISIDLNRHEKPHDERSSANSKFKPTITLTNSETGIKVVAKGHSISSALHADNTQHVEHVPLERKYFKKSEAVLEHIR